MLDASYEIWGIVAVVLLAGALMVKCFVRRRCESRTAASSCTCGDGADRHADVEHRALMFLMNQKTDEILAALARTIDAERQKLGVVVRNPSIAEAVDAYRRSAVQTTVQPQSEFDRILPLADEGLSATAIARELHLPETEVSMVMRLHAA